jgi:hypothetical protein
MARTSTRSEREIKRLLKGYQDSGLTRGQYCAQQGIAVTTLDYYRRRCEHQDRRTKAITPAPLLRVELSDESSSDGLDTTKASTPPSGFALVLAKGRRIESNHWNFQDADLARLIRIVETS